jgi:uncharacterized membrane protein YbhN (UPF0104 family)
MKAWLLFLLKLALTLGCLWWAFSGIDFGSTILSRPGDLDFRWVAAGVGFAGVSVLLTAVRWRIFLDAQDIDVPLREAVELTLIGNLFSLVSAGSLGNDAARILLLIRRLKGRKLAVTVSVLADHMSGMIGMAAMFFLLTAGRFGELEQQSSIGRGVLRFTWVYFIGAAVALLALFVMMSPAVHGRVHRGGRWLPWKIMATLPQAWDIYRKKWRHVLAGVGVSCVMLGFYYLTFWAGARAVGCWMDVVGVFSVMPVVDAISSIPVSISGIGVRENLFKVLLADLAGVPGAMAVSASLVGFFMYSCWAVLGGMLFLRRRR